MLISSDLHSTVNLHSLTLFTFRWTKALFRIFVVNRRPMGERPRIVRAFVHPSSLPALVASEKSNGQSIAEDEQEQDEDMQKVENSSVNIVLLLTAWTETIRVFCPTLFNRLTD